MSANGKIKVLQTIRQGLIGGGESHVLGLVSQLDKSMFEPIVLSFTDGQMMRQLDRMGVRNVVIPSGKPFDPRTWTKVNALLKAENIALVHAHGSRAASNLLLPARISRLPMIYTIHGWSFHDDQPFLKKAVRVWSERLLTSNMRCNISVSASNRQTGVDHFKGFRSVVINNGIDTARFNPDITGKDIRTELDIPAHHTLVGYIARITHQKDPLNMIRAFAAVLKQERDITLLMVGEGDLRAEAIALAEGLGIMHNVVFQDFREDVPDLLRATDIYCLPSLWEGLPIGLLEAMAMRNAVIVTNVDGSREIIRNGENGLMVSAQHKEDLANAILRLHRDTLLREQLQLAARETVAHAYSVSNMTRAVEAQYQEVLGL